MEPPKKRYFKRKSFMTSCEGDAAFKAKLDRMAKREHLTVAKLVRLALDATYPELNHANPGTDSEHTR
jgi:predicted DNA-binding ribbon-helix-helix protein